MNETLLASLRGVTYEDWLGKDNVLGQSIMTRKYVREGELFPEWLYRVSDGDEDLARLIFEKKLLLGGRTMANRGTETRASYFNCYSRGFVEDDYRDIMQAAVDIGSYSSGSPRIKSNRAKKAYRQLRRKECRLRGWS